MKSGPMKKWTILLAVAIFFAQLGAPFGLRASQTVDGQTIIVCTGTGFKTIQVDAFGEETSPQQDAHFSHCCLFCPSPFTARSPAAPVVDAIYAPTEGTTAIVWPSIERDEFSPLIALSWSSRAPPRAA